LKRLVVAVGRKIQSVVYCCITGILFGLVYSLRNIRYWVYRVYQWRRCFWQKVFLFQLPQSGRGREWSVYIVYTYDADRPFV